MKVKTAIIIGLVLFSGILAHGQEWGILQGNMNTSGVSIFKEIPLNNEPLVQFLSDQNRKCIAAHGTRARALERSDYNYIKDFWTKIEALDRNCAGEIGWVVSNDFKFQ